MLHRNDDFALPDPFGDDWPGTALTPEPASGTSAAPRPPAIWADAGRFDPAAIPRRRWIVPGLLLRGAVTLATGAGASGKSTVATAVAITGAVGTPLGRFKPANPFKAIGHLE